MSPRFTAENVRDLLHYDPDTGVFTWRIRPAQRTPKGSTAGTDNGQGYVAIGYLRRTHKAHRLAWLYMTGQWPTGEIDHKNGNRSDNRWRNLRIADRFLNNQNTRGRNRNRLLGVDSRKNGKYEARIYFNNRKYHIGTFPSEIDAHIAYIAHRNALHSGWRPEQ